MPYLLKLQKILNNTPGFVRYPTIFLALLGISILMSIDSFDYSIWKIDEEFVVAKAVGFLDLDFNPRWFGYHTLPMYILSFFYFIIWGFYQALGLVSSNVEFAAQLFEDETLFFVTGRFVFSFAYCVGCLVVTKIFYHYYESPLGAVLLMVMLLFQYDAVAAANKVRVDTFVFTFISLTIYFSCVAPKKLSSFILSLLFCCAALCSKIPALVFVPVLYVKLILDIRAGFYPKKYIWILVLLPPVATFCFMPYLFIEYKYLGRLLRAVFKRAVGHHSQLGKVSQVGLLDKLTAFWRVVALHVGSFSIIASIGFFILAVVKKQKFLFPTLFIGAFAGVFSMSSFVDGYWLRPVYPFLLLFTMCLLYEVATILKDRGWLARFFATFKIKSRPPLALNSVLAVGFFGLFFYFQNNGIKAYLDMAGDNGVDTRLVATNWINKNLPANSKIILPGIIQHYLPRVVSSDKQKTLKGKYLNPRKLTSVNPFLTSAYDFYYEKQARYQKKFNTFFLANRMTKGSYVVISDWWFTRFLTPHYAKTNPKRAQTEKAFLKKVKRQPLIKRFTGSGPTIEIYKMKEATWRDKKNAQKKKKAEAKKKKLAAKKKKRQARLKLKRERQKAALKKRKAAALSAKKMQAKTDRDR